MVIVGETGVRLEPPGFEEQDLDTAPIKLAGERNSCGAGADNAHARLEGMVLDKVESGERHSGNIAGDWDLGMMSALISTHGIVIFSNPSDWVAQQEAWPRPRSLKPACAADPANYAPA